MCSKKYFFILSIDGGGIRGIFPAHILKCIHQNLSIDIFSKFDLIAGTSTGSIIAAAVARKIDPEKIEAMYKLHGRKIFSSKLKFFKRITSMAVSTYDSSNLRVQLEDTFGDVTLGECCDVPLIIPATDIVNNTVHIFKTKFSEQFVRDVNVKLSDAVLASCSAPTYFDPSVVDCYTLADGGLWANNPSLAAVVDANHRLKIPLENIRVLSIGTGEFEKGYKINSKISDLILNKTKRKSWWGFLTGWQSSGFIDFLMSVQTQSIHNYLSLLLPKENIMRINYSSPRTMPLDDCSSIDEILSIANRTFSCEADKIKKFLDVGAAKNSEA